MKRIAFCLALLCGVAAHAQAPQFTCANASTFKYRGAGASGTTELLPALTAGGPSSYFVCSYSVQITEPATPVYFSLAEGTGTNCGTGTASRTIEATDAANTYPSIGAVFTSDAALRFSRYNAVCLNLTGAVTSVSINIRYVTALGL